MAEVRHHRAQQAEPAGTLAEPPLAFVEGDRWLTPQKQYLGSTVPEEVDSLYTAQKVRWNFKTGTGCSCR